MQFNLAKFLPLFLSFFYLYELQTRTGLALKSEVCFISPGEKKKLLKALGIQISASAVSGGRGERACKGSGKGSLLSPSPGLELIGGRKTPRNRRCFTKNFVELREGKECSRLQCFDVAKPSRKRSRGEKKPQII